MRINKMNINEMKKGMDKKSLKWYVLNSISKEDNIKEYIEGVLNHGCVSGYVTDLVYYNQTDKFFKNHYNEILKLLQNDINECSQVSFELNANNLSWFAYEETLRAIAYELEMKVKKNVR